MACRLMVTPGSLAAGARTVEGEAHHYLFRVRRLRVDSPVVLFDGAGVEADARVTAIDADRAVLAVEPPRRAAEADPCRLTVMPALIKGERMDFCIQKLVELGVAEIAPVITARTVVRLAGERAERRRRRYVDIARAAARQSGRARVPVVRPIAELDQALAGADAPLKLVAWVGERTRALAEVLAGPRAEAACVLIGPEGGFTPEEIERALAAGFAPVHLGPHVLRAETAALAVAAAFALLPAGTAPPNGNGNLI